jgi:hypothetical protein
MDSRENFILDVAALVGLAAVIRTRQPSVLGAQTSLDDFLTEISMKVTRNDHSKIPSAALVTKQVAG